MKSGRWAVCVVGLKARRLAENKLEVMWVRGKSLKP